MTSFDDREKGFETKFARDEEMAFRIVARRNRLLGEWAARLMGLTEVEGEAYAKEVNFASFLAARRIMQVGPDKEHGDQADRDVDEENPGPVVVVGNIPAH